MRIALMVVVLLIVASLGLAQTAGTAEALSMAPAVAPSMAAVAAQNTSTAVAQSQAAIAAQTMAPIGEQSMAPAAPQSQVPAPRQRVAPALSSIRPTLRLTECTAGKAKLPAHCGTLFVAEDRSEANSRRIGIHFIVIDAARPTKRAIFWNPGGPGGDELSIVPYIVDRVAIKELMALHDRYNLVFIDNRGTGLSHPLNCDLYPPRHPEWYYRQEFPDQPVRACHAALARTTKLSAYTTDASVDDLDDVRSALGYSRVVLDGGSYGTVFFLEYARRHPEHVESLVLSGVAPPGFYRIPLPDARGAQSAMTDLIADCGRDLKCRRAFPQFGAHFASLVRRFDRGPIALHVTNAATKRRQSVALSKAVFTDRLRQTLYSSDAAAFVPYVVEQAYRKNYDPLILLIEVVTNAFGRGQAMGLNLTVSCAEDLPFITEAQIARASAGTFEGDTRVRAQQRACRIWNVPTVQASFDQPVHSDAPVLMISGADDPATPPEYGRAALRYLPNGRQIVIPHGTHESESVCTDALIVAFVRARDARGIDGSRCVAAAKRPPFALSMKGFGQ